MGCCCCLHVSYHLIVNLFDRFSESIRDIVYCRCRKDLEVQSEASEQYKSVQPNPAVEESTNPSVRPTLSLANKPRYVVINDTVELEPFFYDIDRHYSELLLKDRPAGTCLVRPFKLKHEHIRYILSIRACGTYFHLFIRHAGLNGMYALGLEKEPEKRFKFPTDIVRYYQLHALECTRATTTVKLQLIPLQLSDLAPKNGELN
ncbi:uncharacterized protein LOC131284126 [Anopheles ziemanni]|uniref:uncharacterized protein LOC131271360 n=1 Tax=Anopheles coustani TaxID=139045 RepID=UPI002657E99F|nr:uncharacterized protein LOC131271360 [Anopheles coustani]XP_058168963.1 uncharacterized protein LOC131284126 [Anopheles ziemanni]